MDVNITFLGRIVINEYSWSSFLVQIHQENDGGSSDDGHDHDPHEGGHDGQPLPGPGVAPVVAAQTSLLPLPPDAGHLAPRDVSIALHVLPPDR